MSVQAKKKFGSETWISLFFLVTCIVFFVLPFLLIVAISFTDESVLHDGYKLIPSKFSLEGYKIIFKVPMKIIRAYVVTGGEAFMGTFLGVMIMALCAYPLSRPNFKWRKIITFYIFFTMLFGGGLVPSYILNSQYLGLRNNFWVLVLPFLSNAFYLIIMKTFFLGIPTSLIEAAKLDGASELKIFYKIILPLSKPVLATISLLFLLDRWNDWFTSLLYISDEKLNTLQYMLQRVLREAEFLKQMAAESDVQAIDLSAMNAPIESMRFGMCIVAAGPMLLIFPFFQKYFVKGLTVGSIKG